MKDLSIDIENDTRMKLSTSMMRAQTISNNNKGNNTVEVSLQDYELNKDEYLYLIIPNGRVHLWGWIDFTQDVNGISVDYKTEGNVILYKIIKTDRPINPLILKKYGLMILDERHLD